MLHLVDKGLKSVLCALGQNLQAQMRDFESSVEPLQDWLNQTELTVQESSSRLHDLPAKKHELHKLQVQFAKLYMRLP